MLSRTTRTSRASSPSRTTKERNMAIRILLSCIAALFCTALPAQNESNASGIAPHNNEAAMPDTVVVAASSATALAASPLHIPTLTSLGTMPSMRFYPYMWGGFHTWDVHEGLNATIGASVFSTFGSGKTYSGAGFSQNLSLVYAKPLTEKLSLAVGGYFNNMYWAHDTFRDAGLTAVLGYQFDEHWSSYLYGQKSMLPNNRNIPRHLMDMGELGDRIGAAVRYSFNPSFSIQVSFDYNRYNTDGFWKDPIRRNEAK